MKLMFMGTAAAEGAPALFCTCDFCRYARKTGGREIRGRAGALLDGRIKLDFGPDSFKQMIDYGIDYTPMRTLLITHSHEDHLQVADIAYRTKGFAQLPEDYPPLTVYGNEKVCKLLEPHCCTSIRCQRVQPFEAFEVEGYTVTALQAVHCVCHEPDAAHFVTYEGKRLARSEDAFFYLIEKDGKSILYAHDTDLFTPEDMAYLKGRAIDLISLDCTNGHLNPDYVGHMGAKKNLIMRERLLANGAADEHTIFVANHFSHNGLVPYEELQLLMPGFVVAYDGLCVDV